MCLTAVLGGLAAAGAAKALTSKPKAATAVVDPATERAAAEAKATQATNSKLAERNRARKASSLLAVDTAGSNAPALGSKTTLGQ